MKCCFVCGKKIEIKTNNTKQRTCSANCRQRLQRQKNKHLNEYLFLAFFFFGQKVKTPKIKKPKKVYQKRKDFSFNCFLESTCGHCGKNHVRLIFTDKPKRPGKTVLCWECSYRHRRDCSYCKQEFSPVSLVGNTACYCIPCRRKLMSITQKKGSITGLYPVSGCRWCLKDFQPKSNRSKCCSRNCTLSFNEMVRRTGQEVRFSGLINCVCGKLISATARKCPPCTFENKLQRRGIAQARRYEAMRLGDRGINWRSLGKRDGWVCYLCNWVVQQRAGTAYKPFGGTVDHLIPLSKGGTHTWDNVALAHRRCNTSRGNKDLELSDVES
jgi:5-methylcytosine-specific restriction endonuclease McrA/predicted nucleic acid-binding Zn ribbon protein